MPSIRDAVKENTMYIAGVLCNDVSFIPEEMRDWSPMDFGRSANAILDECAKSNMSIAAAIKGEELPPAEAAIDFNAMKDYLMASAQEVCNAIDSLSDADLEEGFTQMPWGPAMSTIQAISTPAGHMMYHDGQINYIQTLLGDTKFHWGE